MEATFSPLALAGGVMEAVSGSATQVVGSKVDCAAMVGVVSIRSLSSVLRPLTDDKTKGNPSGRGEREGRFKKLKEKEKRTTFFFLKKKELF